YNFGARPQRLLWGSTGTKNPAVPEVLYAKALAPPFTVNTMPEQTLKAVAAHTESFDLLPADAVNSEEILAEVAKEGIDIDAVAIRLQVEEAKSIVNSWTDLI